MDAAVVSWPCQRELIYALNIGSSLGSLPYGGSKRISKGFIMSSPHVLFIFFCKMFI